MIVLCQMMATTLAATAVVRGMLTRTRNRLECWLKTMGQRAVSKRRSPGDDGPDTADHCQDHVRRGDQRRSRRPCPCGSDPLRISRQRNGVAVGLARLATVTEKASQAPG